MRFVPRLRVEVLCHVNISAPTTVWLRCGTYGRKQSTTANFEETVRMNDRMLIRERMARLIGPGIAAATLLAACGGYGGSSNYGAQSTPPPTPPAAPNPPPTPTPTPT